MPRLRGQGGARVFPRSHVGAADGVLGAGGSCRLLLGGGVVLYLVIAGLVAAALFVYPVRRAELTPPYWGLWSIVFPISMYGAASHELGIALACPGWPPGP